MLNMKTYVLFMQRTGLIRDPPIGDPRIWKKIEIHIYVLDKYFNETVEESKAVNESGSVPQSL